MTHQNVHRLTSDAASKLAGAVARWLPAKKRFEVTLEATDELPETSLALKAEHLSIVG